MQSVISAVSRSLNARMLGHGLSIMRPIAQELGASFSDRLDSIQRNYQYMADYFMSGQDDPLRLDVIDSLVRDAYVLLDDLVVEKQKRDSVSYEYREMLRPAAEPTDAESTFRYFWLSSFDEEHANKYMQLLADSEMEDEALMAVSGLTLALMRAYNNKALLALLSAAREEYAQCIRERAWVGALLTMFAYDERLRFFPEIIDALQDLLDTEDGMVFACTTTTCLLRTLGIPWASNTYQNMQGKLVPFLSKHLPKSTDLKVISPEELDDFSAKLGEEFADLLEQQRHEMAQVQEAHLDTQFAMFKDMYATSFFSEPYRWWLPYSEDYLTVDMLEQKKINAIFPMNDLCDSDRYAFITTMAKLGVVNGKELTELSEIPLQMSTEHLLCNDYVKQIYRFFNLNPWQLENPFKNINQIGYSSIFRIIYPSASEKKIVANLLLQCRAYNEAASLFSQIADALPSADVYRNWGLCLQKQEDFPAAIKAYQKADTFGFSEWTTRQLEFCYTQLEDYHSALALCERLVECNPQSEAYLYEKAMCLQHVELFAEALDILYRIELINPGMSTVWRAIAWCAFMCDDFASAQAFYRKIQDAGKEDLLDWLNQGHLLFVTGKRMEAFQAYLKCLRQSPTLKAFLAMFRPDRKVLIEKGISKMDVYLMEDQLLAAFANT